MIKIKRGGFIIKEIGLNKKGGGFIIKEVDL